MPELRLYKRTNNLDAGTKALQTKRQSHAKTTAEDILDVKTVTVLKKSATNSNGNLEF